MAVAGKRFHVMMLVAHLEPVLARMTRVDADKSVWNAHMVLVDAHERVVDAREVKVDERGMVPDNRGMVIDDRKLAAAGTELVVQYGFEVVVDTVVLQTLG